MTQLIARHRTLAKVIVTVSTAVAMSGALAVIPQIASALTSADVEQLISLGVIPADKAAAARALVGGTPPAAPAGACSFTRDLTVGVRGDDVKCLQTYLTATGHFTFSGGATSYFGSVTKSAVSAWQAANGVSPTAGYFGAISRAKYNSVVAAAPAPAPVPGVPPAPVPVAPVAGDALRVEKHKDQPGDNIAPGNATRIPVTKFTLTAGVKDVTVRSITAERIGLATDSAVDKVVLLGADGLQIGREKTLGSNHRSVLSEPFVIKAGESKDYTIGFNRPAANESGNVLTFDVVAIDASSPLTGTLPIRGSQITMNTSLTIGDVTLTRGVNDPGASATSSKRSIGDTAYKFAALRLTAGAAEDLNIKSVSWYQAGSIGAADLGNVKIVLADKEYPATVSSDGKYYSAKFDGVALLKGGQAELYIKGDLVGGTNRDVEFQLFRDTDLDIVGKSFGFGLKPGGGTATAGSVAYGALSSDTEPAFRGYVATVGQGTLTVSKSVVSAGAAQNVAVNLEKQPLGAFDVDVKGENITVSSMVFRVSAAVKQADVAGADYTSVALYDEAGNLVAGPKDGSGTSTETLVTITFTDAVEFASGKKSYILRGKLSTDVDNNTLVSASTTPSTDWSSAVGRVSGVTITPASVGTITANTMTVKTAALTASIGNTPPPQTLIRGTVGFTFANVVFDATASGEDLRMTSAIVQLFGANGNEVKNCGLYDGTVNLTTGSNGVNPTGEGDQTFTFDNAIIIPKGTVKTLALKCDTLASGTASKTLWSFSSNETFGTTGITSGSSVTATVASSSVDNVITMAASGSFTVILDGSSPAVRMAQAGQDSILSVLRFTATNEAVDLKQIRLQLTNTASNSPSDLSKITLWDGATKVGEFTATTSDIGLLTTVTGFVIPKNGDKLMTIKGSLAPIGVDESGRPGHLLSVDLHGSDSTTYLGTYGVGVGSSQNVISTSGDTASAGVRIVRAYPTITNLSVPSNSLADASQKVLYRFSVSAPSGTNGVSLYKFVFGIATKADDAGITGYDFTITNLRLYAFTSSNFSGGAYSADGQLNNGTTLFDTDGNNPGSAFTPTAGGQILQATTSDYAIYFNPASPTSAVREAIHVPAGSTYYFELKGDVAGADSGDSATVQLMGDSGWVGQGGDTLNANSNNGFLSGNNARNYTFALAAPILDASSTVTGAAAGATGSNVDRSGIGNDFIWSGNSTTTHTGASGDSGPDWYNGFLVPGLPSSGAPAQTFSL